MRKHLFYMCFVALIVGCMVSTAKAQWNTTGNVGTSANFLGTTNNVSLRFRTNNIQRMIIDSLGKVGIGTTTPAALLDVAADILVNGITIGMGKINDTTNTAVGRNALASIVNFGTSNTAIGSATLQNNTTGSDNSAIGRAALRSNTTGSLNTANGAGALFSNTTGNYNTASGNKALYSNTSGSFNTVAGYQALNRNTTGSRNTINGVNAMYFNTTGSSNSVNGFNSLTNNTTGSNNTGDGFAALSNNTIGNNNTATGSKAIFGNTTGNYNTAMGDSSLTTNTTGNKNTALGYGANVSTANLTNATAIGAHAAVGASNSLVLGSIKGINGATDSTKVGIGTTTPAARLDVIGNVKITDGTQGAGKVLTSDANGLASWQTISSSGGVNTIDAIEATSNPNGAVINGNSLSLAPADSANGGVVTTGAQKFSGEKTFKSDLSVNGLTVGKGGGNQPYNTAIGEQALHSNTTGYFNSANGYEVLFSNKNGQFNTGTGSRALYSNTVGNDNTAYGYLSLFGNTSGQDNTAIGGYALLSNTYGFANAAIGTSALTSNTTGSFNSANGYGALINNTTGSYNSATGYQTLFKNVTGNENTALGYFANVSADSLTNATAIGAHAAVGASNSLVLGSIKGVNGATDSTRVGIGTTTPAALLDVAGDVLINGITAGRGRVNDTLNTAFGINALKNNSYGVLYQEGKANTAIGFNAMLANTTGYSNTGIGRNVLYRNTNGSGNTATGDQALYSNTTGQNNTANGAGALFNNTTGNENSANGAGALFNNTTGSYNLANGYWALFNNTTGNYNLANGYLTLSGNTTGNNNSATGYGALFNNTTGNNNSASGYGALVANTTGNNNAATGYGALSSNTTGNYNTAMGDSSLTTNTTGSKNTVLGYGANVSAANLSNATALGAHATVGASNSLVLGSIKGVNGATDSTRVGIGTTTPAARLDVIGKVKITDGTQGAGKVLTSDANGLASWQTISGGGSGWALTGNTGISALTSFLGTTDNKSLRFRTNNIERVIFDSTGNVGIGTAGMTKQPGKLTVRGSGSAPANVWVNSGIPLFAGFGEATLGNADYILNIASDVTGVRPVFIGRRARGTLATPAVVNSNDFIMSFLSSGFDGTNFVNAAGIDFFVDSTPTAGSVPTRISFVTGRNPATRLERLQIGNTGNIAFNNNMLFVRQDKGNIGIGTQWPDAKLQIEGNIRIKDGTQGAGKVLTSDALGFATWQTPTTQWITSGNNISNSNSGNVGIGTAAPTQKLTVFNGTTTGTYTTTGWVHSSDERLKTNIKPLTGAVAKLKQLQGVSYNWKELPNSNAQIGFIAQDVEKVFPEVIVKDEKGNYGMAQQNLIAPLVEAVKELSTANDAKDAAIKELEKKAAKVDDLQKQIDELKAALLQLASQKTPCTTSK